MSSTPVRMQATETARRGPNWSAIWSGVFIFAAIWGVFESLAWAIFHKAGLEPTPSMGMDLWAVVLAVLALYFAGRETARLAGVTTKHDGITHGLVMFGLSTVTLMVLSTLATVTLAVGGAMAIAHNLLIAGLTSRTAWTEFLALLLGGLAAMWGGSMGIEHKSRDLSQTVQARPAA